jgi:dipeptidyl aminopeptidase/acylaminoacyl peptidase
MFTRAVRACLTFAIQAICASAIASASGDKTALASADAGRGWTISASIALRYFENVGLSTKEKPFGGGVSYSPDRKYFAVVIRHGDVGCDCNIFELSVYRVTDVKAWLGKTARTAALEPFRKVSVSSFLGKDEGQRGIASLSWDSSGSKLYFLGAVGEQGRQVMSLDLDDGKLVQLTHHERDVRMYAANGKGLCFGDLILGDPSGYPTYPVQGLRYAEGGMYDGELLTPALKYVVGTRQNFYISYDGSEPRKIDVVINTVFGGNAPVVAPDGELAIAIDSDNRQFRLLNLQSDEVRPVFDTPMPDGLTRHGAYSSWSPDGQRVALISMQVDEKKQTEQPILMIYGPRSRSLKELGPLPRYSQFNRDPLLWRSNEDLSVFYRGKEMSEREELYKVSSLQHESVSAAARPSQTADGGLRVETKEDANHPPELVVSSGARSAVLLAPNRELLRGVGLARQQPFQWKESGGKTVTGGFYLPRGYQAGNRVPLVVQAYFYRPDKFLPDGENTTADAAQLLASHGMAVLKYDIPRPSEMADPKQETTMAAERFQAAVSALVQEGIVDADEVGMTGFSRAGFQVYYHVTHPGQIVLAAAVSADSYVGDFPNYLLHSAMAAGQDEDENVHGGGSFWNNKSRWLERDNTFNIEHSKTPYLVTMHGNGESGHDDMWGKIWSTLQLQRVGAFMANRRPIDYLYFPQGSHNLQRPLERIAMLTTVVDWMEFWLQCHEDSDPAKQEKYARWRKLRSDWQAQQAWEAAGHSTGSAPTPGFAVQ